MGDAGPQWRLAVSDDLAAFVHARIAEDKLLALCAGTVDHADVWTAAEHASEEGRIEDNHGEVVVYNEGAPDRAQAMHIARHDPARELREVEAKRKRLALMNEAHAEMDRLLADKHAGLPDQAMAVGRARAATVAVKHDAEVYSDHPDYRQEWKP